MGEVINAFGQFFAKMITCRPVRLPRNTRKERKHSPAEYIYILYVFLKLQPVQLHDEVITNNEWKTVLNKISWLQKKPLRNFALQIGGALELF